jgi:branched-chain amino acid transport system ATP-binding protein
VLEVEDVSKRFGGLSAISDLSFNLARGEVLGIIGPNGAGKTTLLNLITGYDTPTAGSIRFEGRELSGLPPYAICRMGIARTFQVVRPFEEMSVADNIMTGALFSSNSYISSTQAQRRVDEALDMVDLTARRNALSTELTIGEKKKLELARALATKPRLILLDEVMSGLTGAEIDNIMDVIDHVADSGMTILMIEHIPTSSSLISGRP